MCVSRGGFIGAFGAAAALPLFAEPARALDQVQTDAGTAGEALVAPVGLTGANRRAAEIASNSPFVRVQTAQCYTMAQAIGDAKLRSAVLSVLVEPRPRFMRKYRTQEDRVLLRDALARDGFVDAAAPVSGIFPPVTDSGIAQPFWSAPGSDTNGHHSYPGGLCVHELFNARMATQFAQNYNHLYFDNARAVSGDIAVAAAFYHDIMKAIVFQYRDDGTFLDEVQIGATGAHHCLSGAEAIARGMDANFVIVLLSAHAAPSLGDEARVVTWARAAARIAGVDPVAYGLVKKAGDGYALARPAPIEAFVNHLSDHDYVLSIAAAQAVRPALADMAPKFGVAPGDATALNWWRLQVTSAASEIALYHELLRGESAFTSAVKRVAS
jgi:hypothetical protein